MILKPNWSESYKINYDYATEIITSRAGREQRIAQRITARKSFEYSASVRGAEHRKLHQLLASQQHEPQALPEYTKKIVTTTPAFATAVSITIPGLPDWVYSGRVVFVEEEFNAIISVAASGGNQILQLATPLLHSYPNGLTLYYAVVGNIADTQVVAQETNGVAKIGFRFNVLPGSEDDYVPAVAATVFNGREVLTKRPNWAAPPPFTYSRAVEDLDYGRGVIERFNPIPFGALALSLTFLARGVQEAQDAVHMHARMLGRQGEFYMSSGVNDIVLNAGSAIGDTTLVVAGTDFVDAFENDLVNRAVCVRLLDGTVIYNKVLTVTQGGPNSVITCQTPWSVALTLDKILMISWMPVWRFASDTLTIEWLTDQVAQYQITVQTLEDLPV